MKPGPKQPIDEPWDDERLGRAYRGLAAHAVPADLVGATLEAATTTGRGRFGRPTRRWAVPAFAASAVAVVAIAVLVASLAFRTSPSPASAGRPTTVDGLAVQTVSQALAAEAAGNPPDDGLVAIGGWLTFMPLHSCPYQSPHPELEPGACDSLDLVLTENHEDLVTVVTNSDSGTISSHPASGPSMMVRELEGAMIEPPNPDSVVGSEALYSPHEAVLVGHFHDARAAQCSAEQRAACESAFVVDQLAWFDGRTLGPNIWIGGDPSTGAVLQPRLTPDAVAAALRPSLDPADMVVSMAATSLCGIATITGGSGPGGNCADILWYVRVTGPAPRFPPMAWAAGASGWMVMDDATGRIEGAGGWGFVGLAPGSSPAAPLPTLPDGLFALSTTNWLRGGICAGTGLDAVIYGSPTDPHVAWIENSFSSPPRMEIVWPAGYRARFDPNLEILDANGNVVMREGDTVTGDCGGGDGFVFWPSR
jgi:hypothetical protein